LKLEAPCAHLRLSDARTYWAKPDLGAVMARFDYSPDSHEQSFRFPLAAAWSLAKAVKLVARGTDKALVKKLERFGSVKSERGEAGEALVVDHREGLALLAQTIAAELGGSLGDVIEEADIVVRYGEARARAAASPAAEPAAPRTSQDREMQRLDDLDRALDESPNPLKR
jgi:hypothetical protein